MMINTFALTSQGKFGCVAYTVFTPSNYLHQPLYFSRNFLVTLNAKSATLASADQLPEPRAPPQARRF